MAHMVWRDGFNNEGWSSWWRIGKYGPGLRISGLKGHTPLFSERIGTRKTYHVLGLCIGPLKRVPKGDGLRGES